MDKKQCIILTTNWIVYAIFLDLMVSDIVRAQEESKTKESNEASAKQSNESATTSTENSAEKSKQALFEVTVIAPTGKPLAGATIEIPSIKLKTMTDSKGIAHLQVPFETMEVQVKASGFAPYKETIKFDEALSLAGITIFIPYDLGEVIFTGATQEKLAAEMPIKTQVIERETIERKGASNIADALKHTTGVRVENNCQNCNFTQVRLNGMDGKYSQILINGHPVFSALAGVYGLEEYPSEMVDRIEIIKGGGSALYGGGAVAGVINIITKRPDTNFGNLRIGGFSLGTEWGGHFFGGNVGLVNKKKKLALALSGSLHSREEFDANGDEISDIGMFRQYSLSGDLFWDPFPGTTLTLRLQGFGERRRGGDHLDWPEFDVAVSEGGTILRQQGEIRWKHILRSGLSYEFGYTFAHTSRDSYYGGGGDIQPPSAGATVSDWEEFWAAKKLAMSCYGHTRDPVHFGDFLLHIPFNLVGEMMLTLGGQVQAEHLTDSFPAYSRKTDDTYIDGAGLAEFDWNPAKWNETIVGVRVSKNSEINRVIATPRLAVIFNPLKWLRLRTSFSTGYRAPQVFDEDLHVTIVSGEGSIVKNDPNLRPEISYGGAQQIEFTLALSSVWSLKMSINGFINYLTDVLVLDERDDPMTTQELEFVRINHGRTYVYGGEFEASLVYRNLFNFRGGWTIQHGEYSEADPDFNSKDLFRTPNMYGFIEIWGKLPLGFEPFTAVDITGPMKVPHYAGYIPENRLEQSPWFIDWDVGLSCHIPAEKRPNFKMSLAARNILNSFQSDFDKGPERDAGYVYGPRLPRSFWFELKGEF
uniref:TonB-dependent receptor n=1 Tax=candidate division WOR-3 bacterium TaxID=2052148 RepID=A0A7V3KMB1_UNCW3